ncbi:MAG: ABC transporter ATP-binding protein [Acidimicrobiales bacterium]
MKERPLLPVAGGRETWRHVSAVLGPRRRVLAAAGAMFVARAGAGLVGPAVLGRLVDLVVEGRSADAMTGPVLVLLAAAIAEGAFVWAGPAVAAGAVEPALADLREAVVDRTLHLPITEVERAGTGDVVAPVDGDVAVVTEAVRQGAPELAAATLTIGATVIGLLLLDWRLALAGLVAVPLQCVAVRWYLPRSRPVYAAQRISEGARSQQLLETMGAADTVRALRRRDAHVGLVRARSDDARGLTLRATWLSTRFFGRLNVAEALGLTAILTTGALLIRADAVTVGEVTAASLYFQRVFDPVNTALWLLDEVQSAGAALARLVGVARLPAAPEPPERRSTAVAVAIDGVSFSYSQGHELLRGLSLEIAPGERVAVVGASGAGKSTLAKLVAGMLVPDRGAILVGGRAVRPEDPDVVLVTQEVHVFAGRLEDDLRLGRPGATDEQLWASLATVGADAWVGRLPQGLTTIVGDGGERLTALQAQQLALARLVLADPPVAILDEATAEAGSAGARDLEGAARAATEGRTSLVIAHRLTQAVDADRIVVLEAGRMIEIGNHADLVATGGTYAHLWEAWSHQRAAPTKGKT